jgi:PEP-CTERM motif
MHPMHSARWLVAATLAVASLAAGPARATNILIGGEDLKSGYDAGTTVFSFMSDGAPGVVTSTGGVSGLSPLDVVLFDAVLNSDKCNPAMTPFNPATDFIQGACFVSADANATPDFVIMDASMTTTLLAFNLDKIRVTQAAAASGVNDPDGFIVLGDFTETTTQSVLTLVGGSLAGQVGGIGSTAHLHVRMDSLDPDILTTADLSGYFGSNFSAGDGIGNVPVVWDLLIVPVPEPSTGALLALGLGAIAALRRQARH